MLDLKGVSLHLNWYSLIFTIGLNADHILDATIRRPECPETEDFAQYVDGKYPGLLERFAREYVAEVRPLLEEALPFDGEVEAALADPRTFFRTTDVQATRAALMDHFITRVNTDSSQHVIRAMIAHCELGLGNFKVATQAAGFAVNEKNIANFGEKLFDKDPEARAAMMATERRKAEIIANLIDEFRRKA